MGEKQGGSLKKNNKLIVEQCKLYPKVQLTTHCTACPLILLSANSLPLAGCPAQSQCCSQDTILLPLSRGNVLLHKLLPDSDWSCEQPAFPASCFYLLQLSYIHTADYLSLSTASQLQRSWKDLSSVHIRGNCLYYNQFRHEK